MHAQSPVRHTASDPGARSRFGFWKVVVIAIAVVLVIIVSVEFYIRTKKSITFRGNVYEQVDASCKSLPGDQRLTTIGSIFGHAINGPSSIDQPAVIYLQCFPTGYMRYQTRGI